MPNDYEYVLLAWDGTQGTSSPKTHFETCYLLNGQWMINKRETALFVNDNPPTHWMYLPHAPIGTPPDIVCRRGGNR